MAEAILTTAERRRGLAAAIGCASVAGTAMGLTWPLLALILDSQGVDGTLIGLSSASQSLAVFAAAPMASRLILRFGMIATIAACIAIAVLMLLLLPLYADVYAWFPVRFLLGASTIVLFIACGTWVNQVAPETSRGRIIGVFGLLWSGGFAAGPLIIGVTGIEGWAPFLIGIALILAAAAPLCFAYGLAPAMEGRATGNILHFIRIAPAAMLAPLLLGAVDYALDSFLPLYAMRNGFSQTASVTLLTMLLGGVTAAQLPAGWLADRVDRHRLLFGMTAIAAGTSLVLPAVSGEIWMLWPAVALLGAALGSIWTVGTVLLGQSFHGAGLAGAYGASGILHGIGSIGGPTLAGIAVDIWDPVAVPLLVATCCLLYLPVTLLRGQYRSPSA